MHLGSSIVIPARKHSTTISHVNRSNPLILFQKKVNDVYIDLLI